MIILGDSLSDAYGIAPSKSWVTLLQQKLIDNAYPIKVINESVSGETSKGGMERIKKIIDEYHPDYVIIALGANDGLRGIATNETKKNLTEIIRVSKDERAFIALLEMKLPPNYGPDYTEAFTEIYQKLAKRYRVKLIPFLLDDVALNKDMMQADGLHPNEKAQAIMLEHFWEAMKPYLKSCRKSG